MRGKVFATYTGLIVFLNIVFFLLMLAFGFDAYSCEKNICNDISLRPSDVLGGHNLWTFFTSMFMHAGFTHLLVNMLS
jgi:membrane associated rhomboid family serine protease